MFATFTLSTSPRGDQMALSTDCTTYWGKMPLVGWAQSAPLTCKRSSTSSLKDAIEFIQNNILYSLSLGIAPLLFSLSYNVALYKAQVSSQGGS
jgi:hypothetical protein